MSTTNKQGFIYVSKKAMDDAYTKIHGKTISVADVPQAAGLDTAEKALWDALMAADSKKDGSWGFYGGEVPDLPPGFNPKPAAAPEDTEGERLRQFFFGQEKAPPAQPSTNAVECRNHDWVEVTLFHFPQMRCRWCDVKKP